MDFNDLQAEFQQKLETRQKFYEIINQLVAEHELIFLDFSTNPIDTKLHNAFNVAYEFCKSINQSKDLIFNMNKLKYDMEEYILALNFYNIENKMQPLELGFRDVGYIDVLVNAMIKYTQNIKKETDFDDEQLLIYAYILAKQDIKNRLQTLISNEFKNMDQNNLSPMMLIKLKKWVMGNKVKQLKKLLLKDEGFKRTYKTFKTSYNNWQKTYQIMNNGLKN